MSSSQQLKQIPRFEEKCFTNAGDQNDLIFKRSLEDAFNTRPDAGDSSYMQTQQLAQRTIEAQLKAIDDEEVLKFRMASFGASQAATKVLLSAPRISPKHTTTQEFPTTTVIIKKKRKSEETEESTGKESLNNKRTTSRCQSDNDTKTPNESIPESKESSKKNETVGKKILPSQNAALVAYGSDSDD